MFADGILESSSTTGTGTYTLSGAVFSGRTFAEGFPTGGIVGYFAQTADKSKWEMGYGTLTIGPPRTLTRTVVHSSNADSAVDWQSTDTYYVFSIASADALAGLLAGNLAESTRPWWLRRGGAWLDYAAGIGVSWIAKLYNGSADIRTGFYDAAKALFFPDNRRPSTAIGAANREFDADDVGGSFTFSTSGGARTATLPPHADVGDGYHLELKGLSTANGIILTPDAGDGIDGNSDGLTKTIPGGRLVTVRWDDAADTWITDYVATAPLRGHLAGLTLSAAGGSATFGIAAGQAADDTVADLMTLASAYTKTASSWAVGSGNGGLDTGSVANSTWYHVWVIKRPDTGVVDVLLSTSASSPTMPANYTLKRRVGSLKTDGSAQFVAFIQIGDRFQWATTPALDVSATNPGTSAVSRTLGSVPSGVKVAALLLVGLTGDSGSNIHALISSLDVTDQAPNASATPGAQIALLVANAVDWTPAVVMTNTSQAVRSRVSFSNAATVLYVAVEGWIDRRGRDD